ncbi:MAG: DUF502 domain-containing protein, partial [Halioglobus sp.]|nr:DUF502 domain-containing protein [Halioglobus sp.]
MKNLSAWFLQGLAAILPIALTLAVLYWLGTTAEAALGPLLRWALPDNWYFPGLGIFAGLALVTATGLMVNAYLFSKLLDIANALLSSIPLVSTLFDSIRDIARFADPKGARSEMQRAVLVPLGEDVRVVGFVTNEAQQWNGADLALPVFVPMSYQLGGFTVLVPEDKLEPLDMEVHTAMRWAISAGMRICWP